MTLILLTTEYDKEQNTAVLKFYDTESKSLFTYHDQTGFRPYCLTNIPKENFYNFCHKNVNNDIPTQKEKSFKPKKKEMEDEPSSDEDEDGSDDEDEEVDEISPLNKEQKNDKSISELISSKKYKPIRFKSLPFYPISKYNALHRKNQEYLQLMGKTPLDIADQYNMGGVNISKFLTIKEGDKVVDNFAWENSIQFRYNYIFDNGFVFGMPYTLERKNILVNEPKTCPTCNVTNGNFVYYILEDHLAIPNEKERAKSTVLGKIICDNCTSMIYENTTILQDPKYIPYFIVERELDLHKISRPRKVPIQTMTLDKIDPKIVAIIKELFKNESKEEQSLIQKWLPYFFAPIPVDILRASMDIEVFDSAYDPKKSSITTEYVVTAKYPVSAVSFVGIDGEKIIFLNKIWKEEGTPYPDIPKDLKILEYDQKEEKQMLLDVFSYFEKYPLIITFNGDHFDFPYLYFRAIKLGIERGDIPFKVKVKANPTNPFNCQLKSNISLDLFKFFSSKSLKGYAFKNAYEKNSLAEITKALLPKGKSKVANLILDEDNEQINMANYTKNQLLYYNFNDSAITLELTTYDNYIVMNLLFILMRLSKTGLDDFLDHQISYWIRNLFFFEHRQFNWIIPQESEIRSMTKAFTKAVIDGKGFQGATVKEPIEGIHFDVIVLDFASLYPSIIKTWNLSYETVDCCNHEECKKNLVPQTNHYVCTKDIGIIALIIGAIRDIRVMYFKATEEKNKELIEIYKKSNKDTEAIQLLNDNKFFTVIQNALKVFINAGFGVFSSEDFYFYQIGVGESTTSIGRTDIDLVIKKAILMMIIVLYADTDSVFLLNPKPSDIDEIIKWAWEKFHISLDIDKKFKYIAMTKRKKNYFGSFYQKPNITPDSPLWKKPEIKGLKGKKSNTPPFIKKSFSNIIKSVDNSIQTKNDVEKAKQYMRNNLFKIIKDIKSQKIPLNEITFTQRLSKEVVEYGTSDAQETNQILLEKAKSNLLISKKDVSSFGDQNRPKIDDKKIPLQKRLIEAYKQFDTANMQQSPRCALLLLQKGILVKAGDYISIIKTKECYNKGALPVSEVTSWEQVDEKSYYKEVSSSFDQLYECFGFDTESLIKEAITGKRNLSLDEMMQNMKKINQ